MRVLEAHARETREVGIRWLAEVPAEWSITRLRFICDVVTGSGDTQDAEPDGEYDFYVRSPNPLRSTGFTFDTEAILTAGDGAVGEVFHHVRGRFHAHQRVYVLMNFRDVLPRYFFYYISSFFRLMARDGSARTTVDSVRRWMLTDMPFVLPPLDEQRAIADYLDQETAQIDALVAKQEEFIGLLRERRGAIVTSIIDREGKEQVCPDKLHRHVRVGNGSTPRSGESRYYDGGSIPWLNSSVVNQHEVDQPSKLVTPVAVAECHLPMVKPGSILVALTGQGKTRGAATISRISTTINQHLAFIEPDLRYWVPEYLLSLLHSQYDHLRRISSENGATKGGLTVGDLRALPVIMPGLDAQKRAVEEIDSAISRIDSLIAKAEEHIALAKERRSALITAAVTGQFDVRTAKKGVRV